MDKKNVHPFEILKQLDIQNENTIEFLVKNMSETNDQSLRDKIGFLLIDHFKAESIEDALVELIKDKRWKNRNGTLLYLLSEYTSNPKYLCFLIDLLLKEENENDGEILMNGYSMIIRLHPPLNRKDITKALQRVKWKEKKETTDTERKKLLSLLSNYLFGQREICKFYDKFMGRDK